MDNNDTLIAGEPLVVLARMLPAIKTRKNKDGTVDVSFEVDRETGLSWQRAIERYGADFITSESADPLAARHADAFLRLVIEVADALPNGVQGV